MALKQLSDRNVDGTSMGFSATDLAGFHGTAVAQAAAITAPSATLTISTTPAFGFTTSTQADAMVTAVNSILTALKNKGIIA